LPILSRGKTWLSLTLHSHTKTASPRGKNLSAPQVARAGGGNRDFNLEKG